MREHDTFRRWLGEHMGCQLSVGSQCVPNTYSRVLLQPGATCSLPAGSQLCCEPGWDTCSWPCSLGSLGLSGHLCQGLSKEFILEDVLKYHELQSQWERQSWKAPQPVFAVPEAFCLTVRGQIHWLFPSELLTRRGAVPWIWIRKSCTALQESCQEGEGVF